MIVLEQSPFILCPEVSQHQLHHAIVRFHQRTRQLDSLRKHLYLMNSNRQFNGENGRNSFLNNMTAGRKIDLPWSKFGNGSDVGCDSCSSLENGQGTASEQRQ